MPALLVGLLLLAGCGNSRHCAPADGDVPSLCVDVDRTELYARRAAAIAVLLSLGLLYRRFGEGEPVGTEEEVGAVAGTLLVLVAAYSLWPSGESDPAHPAMAARRTAFLQEQLATVERQAQAVRESVDRQAENERQAAKRQAQAAAAAVAQAHREATDPRVQRARVSATQARVQEHLTRKLTPLIARYQKELRGYRKRLSKALARTGLDSHEALLRAAAAHRETVELLERTALLEHSLAELTRQVSGAKTALAELDGLAWRLGKLADLEEAASPLGQRLQSSLAAAEALVAERLRPPERVEQAAREARLFEELRRVKR